jgi:hypothetical protein
VVAAAALFRRFEGGAGIFFLGRTANGSTMTAPLRILLGDSQSTKESNCSSILLRIIIVTKKKSFDINKKEKNQGSKKIE